MKTIREAVRNSVEDSVLNSVRKYVRNSAGFSLGIYPINRVWISVERFVLSAVSDSIWGYVLRPVHISVHEKLEELINEKD
jgi:hypothetical protein